MPTDQDRREQRPLEQRVTRFESPLRYFPIRDIPSAGYLAENIACSISAICASTLGLLALLPLVPFALLRSLIPRRQPSGIRTVVITGASGQIGGAFLRQYDTPKYHLILFLREGSEFAEPKQATFERVTYDQAKSTGKELLAMFKELALKHNGIDILVAVSGISGHMEEAYERAGTHHWGLDLTAYTNKVNVEGTTNIVLSCWEAGMVPWKKGSIAIIASSAGLFAPVTFAAYAASKAYVYHLGQHLRILSVPHNIKVTVVCPGLIDSPMTRNMRSYGSSSPDMAFASASGLAGRTARALRNNEGTVLWPRTQVVPLYAASSIGMINEEIGRWLGASIYAAGKIIA